MFYSAELNLRTAVAPINSGYTVQSMTQPAQIWRTVGVGRAVAVLIFLFREETRWPGDETVEEDLPARPRSWLRKRRDTALSGIRIMPTTEGTPRTNPLTSVRIGLCPILLLVGLVLTVSLGWVIAENSLLRSLHTKGFERGCCDSTRRRMTPSDLPNG